MKNYTIGSKINLNGREFEIVDIWFGQKLISDHGTTTSSIYYLNLKDTKGHIWGPIGLNITK